MHQDFAEANGHGGGIRRAAMKTPVSRDTVVSISIGALVAVISVAATAAFAWSDLRHDRDVLHQRLERVEDVADDLVGKATRMAEEGYLPAAIDLRLRNIEASVARQELAVQRVLDKLERAAGAK